MRPLSRALALGAAALISATTLVVTGGAADAAAGNPQYVRSYGAADPSGDGDPGLNGPVGTQLDAQGDLWVADYGGSRVVEYGSDGAVKSSFPVGDGGPIDVSLDSKGDLWVPSNFGALRKYSPSGELLATAAVPSGQAVGYWSAVDEDDNVYAVTRPNIINVFDTNGAFVRSVTVHGEDAPQEELYRLAITADGDILANTLDTVYRLSPDGAVETTYGSGYLTLAMAESPDGDIWTGGGTVRRFAADGTPKALALPSSAEARIGNTVYGIAFSGRRMAISDYMNNRVKEFSLGEAFSDFEPSISGSGRVGGELSVAEPTGVTPTPASFEYAWTVSGSDTVRSTGKTFTPAAGDLGKTVTVSVTAKGDGSEDAPADATRTASVTVLPQQFSDFSPSISGTGVVGDVLTADEGDISPEPASTTYAWTVGDSDEVRSSTSTFTPGAADKGKRATVTVTATGEDGTPETRSESASIEVKGKAFGDFTPTYTGSTIVGETVVAEDPERSEGTSVVSQWQTRGDGDEDWTDVGEDGEFSPQPGDVGKSLRLVQTLSAEDHEDKTSTSAVATIGKGVLEAVKPTISGTAKVGETLTASVGELPEGVSVTSWAWGTVVDGQCVSDPDLDGSSLEVPAEWAGKKVCVEATISKDGYDDSTSVSDGVGPVAKGDAPLLTFAPTISDTTPKVGQELTASLPLARGSESSKGFEWGTRAKDGTCDASIKGSTYTPTVEDLGKDLCVVYTVRDVQGYEDGVSTAAFTSRVREDRKAFVNDTTVRKGQKITISATDLVPGKPYVFRVYGKELTGTAPANGRVSRTWTYPKDAKTRTRKIAVIQRAKPKALYYEVITLRYTR